MNPHRPVIRRTRPAPKVQSPHTATAETDCSPPKPADHIGDNQAPAPLQMLQMPIDHQQLGPDNTGATKAQAPRTGEDIGPQANYEVGYCKPPKATQFKKGERRNPNGRPTKAKNVETIFDEELFQETPVIEGGRKRKMPKVRIGIRKLVNMFAEKTDPKTALTIIRMYLALKGGTAINDASAEGASTQQQSDEALLAWFIATQATAPAPTSIQDQNGTRGPAGDPFASPDEGGDDD